MLMLFLSCTIATVQSFKNIETHDMVWFVPNAYPDHTYYRGHVKAVSEHSISIKPDHTSGLSGVSFTLKAPNDLDKVVYDGLPRTDCVKVKILLFSTVQFWNLFMVQIVSMCLGSIITNGRDSVICCERYVDS